VSKSVVVVAGVATAAFTTFSVSGEPLPARIIKAIPRSTLEQLATKEIPGIRWERLENSQLLSELRISNRELAVLKANVRAIATDPRSEVVDTSLSLFRQIQGEIPGRIFRLSERPRELSLDMQKTTMQKVINELLSETISAKPNPRITVEYLSGKVRVDSYTTLKGVKL